MDVAHKSSDFAKVPSLTTEVMLFDWWLE